MTEINEKTNLLDTTDVFIRIALIPELLEANHLIMCFAYLVVYCKLNMSVLFHYKKIFNIFSFF